MKYLIFLGILIFSQGNAMQTYEPKIQNLNEVKIIGIDFKTSFADGKDAKEIPSFWKKFFDDKIMDKISATSTLLNIVAVYYGYQPDGSYHMLIGAIVDDNAKAPFDLQSLNIPAEQYATIIAKGPFAEAIVQGWKFMCSKDLKYDRKYSYDLEIYDEKSTNDKDSEVKILAAIKK
ncbi:MAG: GyrI-like domain-containing protein [Chlamydiae bacterium]|nr:GyrI-like domain-containing protein [Chlamydiota bacterium]